MSRTWPPKFVLVLRPDPTGSSVFFVSIVAKPKPFILVRADILSAGKAYDDAFRILGPYWERPNECAEDASIVLDATPHLSGPTLLDAYQESRTIRYLRSRARVDAVELSEEESEFRRAPAHRATFISRRAVVSCLHGLLSLKEIRIDSSVKNGKRIAEELQLIRARRSPSEPDPDLSTAVAVGAWYANALYRPTTRARARADTPQLT